MNNTPYKNTAPGGKYKSGFSLIEIIVTSALILVVFGGLFVSMQLMIKIIQSSKAEAGATTLAVDKIEYIRSLSYQDVGTTGGPVYGSLTETSTVVLNDINYTERIAIRYEDDPADGLGYSDDANGVIEDYKKVIVEYSWENNGEIKTLALSTNVTPVGMETGVGGGSLRIIVQDKDLNPVPNAQVTIINGTLATTTNTIQFTNAAGQIVLSGIPAGAGYMVSATKPGYSTDGTVEPTPTNPNPFSRPLTVSEGAVTTKYLTIDRVGDILIATQTQTQENEFFDDFGDDSLATSTSNVSIGGWVVELANPGTGYVSNGSFFSVPISDVGLSRWDRLSFSVSTQAETEALIYVYYDNAGVPTLVPDSVLPGNSAGFNYSDSPVSLLGIDPGTYDTLQLRGELSSIDPNLTSYIKHWVVDYRTGGNPITDVDILVRGGKLLGNDPNPVYKFEAVFTSDGNGEVDLQDVEWDAYSVFPQGYRLAEMCPDSLLSLDPNQAITAQIGLAPAGVGLHVTVVDSLGVPIPDSVVRLFNYDNIAAYDETLVTTSCGQAYFAGNGLTAGATYALDVEAPGYVLVTEYPVIDSSSVMRVDVGII